MMAVRAVGFCSSLQALSLRNRRRTPSYSCKGMGTCARMSSTRVVTWNVNSLRALLRKNPRALKELVDATEPDVLCLQETKLQQQHEELFANVLDGYDCVIFNSSKARLGYSGTATFSKSSSPLMQREINHRIGDQEGRFIMLEYPGVYVVNVYTMNAGTGLKRLETRMSWDSAFRKVIRNLREQGKPVVVVGDLNVAREAADVYDENEVKGQPGFTDLERQSFEDTLETCGLVDAYRMLYPEENERYTYWDYRTRARDRNHGLRIDYALVSEDMAKAVKDVQIFDNIYGSDHCPVAVDLHHGMI